MFQIKVTPLANAQLQKAGSWWLENREKAPEAFREELQRGFALISQQPEVGAKATNVKLEGVRRIHLSFDIDSQNYRGSGADCDAHVGQGVTITYLRRTRIIRVLALLVTH